jgi:hypothetical protein
MMGAEVVMDARLISFGLLEIDGRSYDHDVVLERGVIRKRKKKPSKVYADRYGHTPLSVDESIPWSSPVLIIGTGAFGRLPVMPELYEEARRRGVELIVEPTEDACGRLRSADAANVAAILHVTC